MNPPNPRSNIKPEDVSPSQAKKVLAFLNSATTAEEIAEAVEIRGERDVGIRVAQNILDRRAELGEFTDLKQLLEVRQIGPERFSEIIISLSKRKEKGEMPENPGEGLPEFRNTEEITSAAISNNTIAIVGLGQALVKKGVISGEDIQEGMQKYLNTLDFCGEDIRKPRTFIEPRATVTSDALYAAGRSSIGNITIDCNWGFGLGITIVAIVGPLPGPT